MSKFHEMNSLLQEYLSGETNLTLEDIETRCYVYYENGDLEPSAYDCIMGRIEDLK